MSPTAERANDLGLSTFSDSTAEEKAEDERRVLPDRTNVDGAEWIDAYRHWAGR